MLCGKYVLLTIILLLTAKSAALKPHLLGISCKLHLPTAGQTISSLPIFAFCFAYQFLHHEYVFITLPNLSEKKSLLISSFSPAGA
jgi:hypothetical protein